MTLSDAALHRLRSLGDSPDFSATRFERIEPIGHGGMGTVFRAHDRELHRDVAIKVTSWHTPGDADRLTREGRVLASLEHAGIVPIHDVGRLPDGRVYVVMRLVRGDRLDRHATLLSLADRLRLFDRLCDTVAFAHSRGVVHRDLKPANIMVGPFGEVQVLDWGLAADAGGGGTDGYMAPEQRSHAADARADVHALGAVLADLVPERESRTRPLQAIVGRATAATPAARYPDVPALAADVRRFMDGAAVQAYRETPVEGAARLARTYRTPIGLVVAYIVMRVVLLLWR